MNHPIVFIHGSGDSARIWRLQIEELGKDQRVAAIDLPGHGERPDTLPEKATVQDYVRAVHEIIQNELQLDHPIIAGHSLGGAIALAMALEYGTESDGLILIATGARLRVHPALLEGTRTNPLSEHLRFIESNVAESNRDIIAPMIINEQVEPGPTIMHRDFSASNSFDCMDRLPEITLPALIICGTDDRATPVKYSQFLHNALPGSTLCIIPDAAHYVMREQPERVNQAIRAWLGKH